MRGSPITGERTRAPSPLVGEGVARSVTDEGARREARPSHRVVAKGGPPKSNGRVEIKPPAAPFGATPHPALLRNATFPRKGGRGAHVVVWLCAALLASPALAKPQRVVSLNLCADELALRLADPGVVKSVTWISQDPLNANLAAKAAALPANDGHVEEALAYDPDLVLVGPFADPVSIALLKQVGAPVLQVGAPRSLDGVRREIRRVAVALGEPQRGEALVAEMDARLGRVAVDPSRPRLTTIVLQPNGFTVGPGSLVDEILTRAGLDNLAARRLDIAADAEVPLEVIASLEPDMLILDRSEEVAPSLAEAALDHPAIRALAQRMAIVSLPARLWTCGGPEIAEAVERLAAVAAAARTRRATP
jgi:iron complex transport system substrate-binding protein